MRLWFKILREDYKASSRITTSELRKEDFSLARDLFSRKQLETVPVPLFPLMRKLEPAVRSSTENGHKDGLPSTGIKTLLSCVRME